MSLEMQVLSAVLTILVLLYIFFGNYPLFRIVSYAFIGVAAGYVLALVTFQVLIPRLVTPLTTGDLLTAVVPLFLGVLLLCKLNKRLSPIGNLSMAFMVGVGAAVTIGGSVFGTLFGQIKGTFASFQPGPAQNIVEGFFVLLGTVCTLAYFQYGVTNRRNLPPQRSRLLKGLGGIGQIFIGITLGATFAGVFAASISALSERISAVITTTIHVLALYGLVILK